MNISGEKLSEKSSHNVSGPCSSPLNKYPRYRPLFKNIFLV